MSPKGNERVEGRCSHAPAHSAVGRRRGSYRARGAARLWQGLGSLIQGRTAVTGAVSGARTGHAEPPPFVPAGCASSVPVTSHERRAASCHAPTRCPPPPGSARQAHRFRACRYGVLTSSTNEKEDVLGIIAFIILGLLAGAIAKAIMPGDDPGGIIVTTLIGIAGALVGGFLASALDIGDLDEFFDIGTWLIAIGGALLLLLIYRMLAGR